MLIEAPHIWIPRRRRCRFCGGTQREFGGGYSRACCCQWWLPDDPVASNDCSLCDGDTPTKWRATLDGFNYCTNCFDAAVNIIIISFDDSTFVIGGHQRLPSPFWCNWAQTRTDGYTRERYSSGDCSGVPILTESVDTLWTINRVGGDWNFQIGDSGGLGNFFTGSTAAGSPDDCCTDIVISNDNELADCDPDGNILGYGGTVTLESSCE